MVDASAAITMTVCIDDATTNRLLFKKTLQIGQALIYTNGVGVQII